MAVRIIHDTVNKIADLTQSQLQVLIDNNLLPVGTKLTDITLASYWNHDHTLTGLDTDYLKIDGSNASTTVNIGAYPMIADKFNFHSGQLLGTGDQVTGGTSGFQNFESGAGLAGAFPTIQNTTINAAYTSTLGGFGAYTIEAWCTLRSSLGGAFAPTVFSGQGNTFQVRMSQLAPQIFWFGSPNRTITSGTNIALNTPFHVAFTADNAGNATLFVNGINVGTRNDYPNYLMTTNNYIGNVPSGVQMFPGLIDEFRISNIVRYTGNFTPSTVAFVNDANTKVLLHFDDANATQFTDSSGNGFHFTLNGTPKPTYDLGFVTSISFRNAISRANGQVTIGQAGDSAINLNARSLKSLVYNNNLETAYSFDTSSNLTYPDTKLFEFLDNGVAKFGAFYDGSLSVLPLPIKQAAGASNDFVNLRVSNSDTKWKVDSFFNTTINSTKLTTSGDRTTAGGISQLDNYEGSGGLGQAFSMITPTGSIKFPAYNSFTSGTYTIEAWVYPRAATDLQHLCNNSNTTASCNLRISSGGKWVIQDSNQALAGSLALLNQWQHVALSYDGAFTYIFLNGVLSASVNQQFGSPNAQYIGGSYSPNNTNMAVQNFRVSDTCRYTTSFTPPSGAFTTDAATRLLATMNGNANDTSGAGKNGVITGTLATDYAFITGITPVTNTTRNLAKRDFEQTTGKNYSQFGETGDDETRLPGGNVLIQTVGKTLSIKTGTNAKINSATLVAGTVVVSTTAITANSMIILSAPYGGVAPNFGSLREDKTLRVAGTSFTINSLNVMDTSSFDWWLVEKG